MLKSGQLSPMDNSPTIKQNSSLNLKLSQSKRQEFIWNQDIQFSPLQFSSPLSQTVSTYKYNKSAPSNNKMKERDIIKLKQYYGTIQLEQDPKMNVEIHNKILKEKCKDSYSEIRKLQYQNQQKSIQKLYPIQSGKESSPDHKEISFGQKNKFSFNKLNLSTKNLVTSPDFKDSIPKFTKLQFESLSKYKTASLPNSNRKHKKHNALNLKRIESPEIKKSQDLFKLKKFKHTKAKLKLPKI